MSEAKNYWLRLCPRGGRRSVGSAPRWAHQGRIRNPAPQIGSGRGRGCGAKEHWTEAYEGEGRKAADEAPADDAPAIEATQAKAAGAADDAPA